MAASADAWAAYKGRMRAVRWALLGGIPPAVVAAYLGSIASVVVVLVWLIVVAVCVTYAEMSPCPRCNKPFFRSGAFHNSFAKSCLHCGLPKWAEAERASGTSRSSAATHS